ncbi:neuropeptides capa receptor-like [Acanthaster planci]|uniref:Neuropeptides capa receptor-like n=1 Tax=Acanthaster planci TaxID=133434 RepID=A0A8B7XZR2_ACAPL|nr:neuropeptides capa receptor-like [Acanthaster planci]
MGSDISSVKCSEYRNISEAEAPRWLYTPTDVTFITVGIPVLLCVGVSANLTFLFVLLRGQTMQTNTNVYLASLALADLLYLSLFATLLLWRHVTSPAVFTYPFVNSASCSLYFIVLRTGYCGSVAFVTAVTYERYLALCHPFEHLRIRGPRRVYKIVLTCWLVSLMIVCITIPEVSLLRTWCVQWPDRDEYQEYPSTVADCVAVKPKVKYYSPMLRSGLWFLVMLCNTYMYIRLIHTLVKQVATESRLGVSQRAQQRKRQVAVMIIVNGVVFFLCQAPYHAIIIVQWMYRIAETPSPIDMALQSNQFWVRNFPQMANTIVNPFIYGALNAQYRAAFLEAFGCRRRPREALNVPHPPECAREQQRQQEGQI